MASEHLSDMTKDLRALRGGRVWSLMVSLFGDLAQGKGDKIEGPVLSAIMTELDVKPEAARVALHRLRNDGWITSQKRGRISQHSLTAKGRAESVAASPRIYATTQEVPDDWCLVLLKSAKPALQDKLAQAGLVQLMPRVFVGCPPQSLPKGALMLEGSEAPEWLCDQVAPTTLLEEYAQLGHVLRELIGRLPKGAVLSPLDTAVLRCLVVHGWRRLVLKHAPLPRCLVKEDGAYHQCHLAVDALLTRFPRPAVDDIALEPAGR